MDSSSASDHKIPVVDMGDLGIVKDDDAVRPAEWQRVSQELYDAMSSVGFVYLSNHGVPDEQITDYFKAWDVFFKLDEQTKLKYRSSKNFQPGYIELNREIVETSKNWNELLEAYYMKTDGVFPDSEVPQVRPAATTFITSCKRLSYRILTALAIGLGLERDFFVNTHRGIDANSPPNFTTLKINYYAPLPDTVPENLTRCCSHTDYGSLTLLFQDSMGGLQVRGLDGRWMDAKPIPGTVLINIGDLLQIWTAKRLKATEHRVVVPKQKDRQRMPRYSAAFFVIPDDDVLVQPLDGSTDPPPITAAQHLLNMYNSYVVKS